MELESLLMAQSKLFNFQECLRLIAVNADDELLEIQFAWRAFDELELEKDLESLKARLRSRSAEESNKLFAHLMGRIYAEEQQWECAIACFQDSLNGCGDPILAAKNLIGLGIIEFFRSGYGNAFENFKMALNYTVESDQSAHENEVVAYLWLAQTANALRDSRLAFTYLDRALVISNRERHFYMTVKAHLIQIELSLMNNDMTKAEKSLLIAESILPLSVPTKSLKQLMLLKDRIQEAKGRASFKWIQSESRTVMINPEQQQCVVSDYPLLQKLLEKIWSVKQGLTKEEIFHTLWGGGYHPLHDDNKIYVTVRRLRKLIGDNLEEPKFILRKDDVYLWNTEYGFTRFHHRAFEQAEPTL